MSRYRILQDGKTILLTSGIQHYAEIPAGMEKMPGYVKTFLSDVPSFRDDVRLIEGYPGMYFVMARQGDGRWHVAGINGTNMPKELSIDLGALALTTYLVTDDKDARFNRIKITLDDDGRLPVTLQPQGGFVIILE